MYQWSVQWTRRSGWAWMAKKNAWSTAGSEAGATTTKQWRNAIVAVGLTMTFGVLQIVNFAHGDFLAIGLYLTYLGATLLGLDPYLSLFLVLPLVTLAAAFTYKLLIAPVILAPE